MTEEMLRLYWEARDLKPFLSQKGYLLDIKEYIIDDTPEGLLDAARRYNDELYDSLSGQEDSLGYEF